MLVWLGFKATKRHIIGWGGGGGGGGDSHMIGVGLLFVSLIKVNLQSCYKLTLNCLK